MIETIKLAAGVTLLAVQTEKFKSGCFSFNLMRPHTKAAAPLDALLPSVLLRGSERWPDMRAISMRLDVRRNARHARPPARRNEADRLLR